MKHIKHLFFDLDHTIWDFEKNSSETLFEIFNEYQLQEKISSDFNNFHHIYHQINDKYWVAYKLGKVDRLTLRDSRFIDTLSHFKVDDIHLGKKLSGLYIERSPYKKNLMPNAISTLDYLANKHYVLHLITNGFNEVQHIKIDQSKLGHYFKTITTSENAGYNKPHKKIFDFALKAAGAVANESMMIGDNLEADIEGALSGGIDAIWFNILEEKNTSTLKFYEIKDLKTLCEIL
jgi:putative hydrolase of the HAD superfamily